MHDKVSQATLNLAKKYTDEHGGGGGGGTSNYNDLTHLPTVNGVEFKGTMTSDALGLADLSVVDGILDGTTLDSFADVETALEDKVDKNGTDRLMTANEGTKLDNLANIKSIGSGLSLNTTTGELTATGISINIDTEIDDTSTNPVQNKVIAEALDDKADSTDIPTATSDLTNDSGFITNTVNNLTNYYLSSQTYTKSEVDSLISAITTLNIEVVQTLPTQDISQTTIYLVPKSTAQTSNTYDEYINTTGTSAGWEKIGDTEIDLSNYVQKSQTAGLVKNDGTIDTNTYSTVASMNKTLADIAPIFSESVSYQENDYVIYDGYLYRFTKDHPAGVWKDRPSVPDAVLTTLGEVLKLKEWETTYDSGDFTKITWFGDISHNQVSLNKSTTPTENDTKPITSNAVYLAIQGKADNSTAHLTTDSAETTLADGDYFPFYDTSASAKRKTLWSNIKSGLKAYFDTLYSTIKTLAGLTDTTISSPVSGQILEYNGTKWINGDNIKEFARYGGSKTFSQLTSSLLTEANVDKFFLITDGGTISSADAGNWVLPSGSVIPPDAHIAVIEYSTGVYKFDDFGGYIDISGKADKTQLDTWHATTGTVQSDNTVTFTGLSDSYGYDLYCQNKLIGISSMAKTGSGTSVSITYTVTGASSGDVCKLRILK